MLMHQSIDGRLVIKNGLRHQTRKKVLSHRNSIVDIRFDRTYPTLSFRSYVSFAAIISFGSRQQLFLSSSASFMSNSSNSKDQTSFAVDSPPRTPPPCSSLSSLYSSYEHWVRRLYLTNLFHPVKLGLDNIHQLHKLLGSPLDDPNVVVIHIAGTNGKGSVAFKIAKTLELHKPELNVGLFISPHISSFRERMQVNSIPIQEAHVVQYLPRIYEICQTHNIPATFFEITTALACLFYQKSACRVIVLETGLGGRLDATNVVQKPAISVITSIGLEHTRILGDTIDLIAREKAGIMKSKCPVLVGSNAPHKTLRQCAVEKGVDVYYTVRDILGMTPLTSKPLTTELDQDYDAENSQIATAALRIVQASHSHILGMISEECIVQGTSLRPPCRFEVLQIGNLGKYSKGVSTADDCILTVVLDVAHNPPAMNLMVQKLHRTFSSSPSQQHTRFRMVVGFSSDKNIELCGKSIMQAVSGDETQVHLAEAAHPRAASVEAILEATGLHRCHYDLNRRCVTHQVISALALAKQNKEILVVCGSVFIMAEAREALGIVEPRDSAFITEVAGAGGRHSQENFGNSTTTTMTWT